MQAIKRLNTSELLTFSNELVIARNRFKCSLRNAKDCFSDNVPKKIVDEHLNDARLALVEFHKVLIVLTQSKTQFPDGFAQFPDGFAEIQSPISVDSSIERIENVLNKYIEKVHQAYCEASNSIQKFNKNFGEVQVGEYFLAHNAFDNGNPVPFLLDDTNEGIPTRLIDGHYYALDFNDKVMVVSREVAMQEVVNQRLPAYNSESKLDEFEFGIS